MVNISKFTKEEIKRISIRLHAVRVLTGLSREDFSEEFNISSTSLKNWENGRAFPRSESLTNLISCFKSRGIIVSHEWVLYGSNAGPNYATSQQTNNLDDNSNLISEHIESFKKLQRSIGRSPVISIIRNNNLHPDWKIGDVIGGFLVAEKFVLNEMANHSAKNIWLLSNESGHFVPVFLYKMANNLFYAEEKNGELLETSARTFAAINWHYSCEHI